MSVSSLGNGKILERSEGQGSQISGREHGRKEGRDTHRLRGTKKTGERVNSLCGRGPRTPAPEKASQFSHPASLYFSNLTGPTLFLINYLHLESSIVSQKMAKCLFTQRLLVTLQH